MRCRLRQHHAGGRRRPTCRDLESEDIRGGQRGSGEHDAPFPLPAISCTSTTCARERNQDQYSAERNFRHQFPPGLKPIECSGRCIDRALEELLTNSAAPSHEGGRRSYRGGHRPTRPMQENNRRPVRSRSVVLACARRMGCRPSFGARRRKGFDSGSQHGAG